MSALDRAALYSTDSSGNPIAKVDKHAIGYGVMPVKETPRHALSQANTETSDAQLEQDKREREARSKFDALCQSDRELLRLHLVVREARDKEMPCKASQRAAWEAAGWYFVRAARRGAVCVMVKSFPQRLTAAEIGEVLDLSAQQVRRRLSAFDPLLVRYAELRGWI